MLIETNMKEIKYKIEKTMEPKENITHKVVYYKKTNHGCGCGKVFEGTFKECKEFLERK